MNNYIKSCRFEDDVKAGAGVILNSIGKVRIPGLGWWKFSVLDSYCMLGKEFSSDGSWDKHIKSPCSST